MYLRIFVRREINIVESREAKYEPGLLIMSRDDTVQEIYFVDSYGDYYDEITGKRLIKEEVISARLGEMVQFAKHHVYDKVPIQQCIERTG